MASRITMVSYSVSIDSMAEMSFYVTCYASVFMKHGDIIFEFQPLPERVSSPQAGMTNTAAEYMQCGLVQHWITSSGRFYLETRST